MRRRIQTTEGSIVILIIALSALGLSFISLGLSTAHVQFDTDKLLLTLDQTSGDKRVTVVFHHKFSVIPRTYAEIYNWLPFEEIPTTYTLYNNQTANSALQLPPMVVGTTPTVAFPNNNLFVTTLCTLGGFCPIDLVGMTLDVKVKSGGIVTCWLQGFDPILNYFVDLGINPKTPQVQFGATGLVSSTRIAVNNTLLVDANSGALRVQMVCTVASGTTTIRFDKITWDAYSSGVVISVTTNQQTLTSMQVEVDYNLAFLGSQQDIIWTAFSCPTGSYFQSLGIPPAGLTANC